MQANFVLFKASIVAFGENLGISANVILIYKEACIQIHNPKPWKLGKTPSIPIPTISLASQQRYSSA
jgi:hypothetical protein